MKIEDTLIENLYSAIELNITTAKVIADIMANRRWILERKNIGEDYYGHIFHDEEITLVAKLLI